MTELKRRRVHTAKMDQAWSAYKSERAREHSAAVATRIEILLRMRMKIDAVYTGQALEREAVALYRQYGYFLPGPAKDFFRKLAIHLQWQDLMKVTK